MVKSTQVGEKKIASGMKAFFESDVYPAVVALLVILGHVLGIEIYLGAAIIAMVVASLILCDGIKPFIMPLITFIYLVNLKHTPGHPNFNDDYYFKAPNVIIIIILAAVLVVALVYRSYKIFRPNFRRSTIMLLPLSLLSLAFLCNGFFSGGYSYLSLVYGITQIAVYFFLFYLFYFGLRKENFESLMRYLTLVTVLAAMVLVAEMAFLYIAYRDLVIQNGAINQNNISLGWGIWNPVGVSIALLIPMQIYGAIKYKRPYIYILSAILTYAAALLTLSRNAMIFATAALLGSVVVGCFYGKRKKAFRIVTAVGGALTVIFALAGAVLFFDRLPELFGKVFAELIDPNGRLELWAQGLNNFRSAPIFGTGFMGFGENETFEAISFIPDMAHNTVIQLFSSMGIFGFGAYLYYRVCSLKPFFKVPTLEKTMMLMAILTVLIMSLLDNFVFYIYIMFYPTILLAVAHRFRYDGERRVKSFDANQLEITEDCSFIDVRIKPTKK